MPPKVYIDTSVVVALANPEDDFHSASVDFMERLQRLRITHVTGIPITLEVAKAAQVRDINAALTILNALDMYKIEVTPLSPRRLSDLTDAYVTRLPAGARYRFDLLHYASATLLSCTHLTSWDKKHFNQRIERKVNEANFMAGLAPLKVGDPIYIGRALSLA